MEKNGNTFIAAIDCIGHGVPAAMLSFMVHYTLADLINENAELSAGDMMSQLNERMLDSLSREKSKNFNAAADMSLCKISACRTKLEYAGAGSPIIIQQGNVFTRIKAEPYSIADSVLNLRHSYKTTEIKLNTKDRVYLFTDGLAHQHGGNGKVEKFGYKKLAEHLKLKAGHALRDVKQSIVSSLEAWQGRQEQTDDIMILCVEI
ncbi:MAG: PP2C family protein-serine/threonine phosphatase [Flavobacteriales bacterium]